MQAYYEDSFRVFTCDEVKGLLKDLAVGENTERYIVNFFDSWDEFNNNELDDGRISVGQSHETILDNIIDCIHSDEICDASLLMKISWKVFDTFFVE